MRHEECMQAILKRRQACPGQPRCKCESAVTRRARAEEMSRHTSITYLIAVKRLRTALPVPTATMATFSVANHRDVALTDKSVFRRCTCLRRRVAGVSV